VINSLITDFAKICLYNVPINGDSVNIAVVKKPSENAVCQYEIRYFGFDFSWKWEPLDMSVIQKKPSVSPKMIATHRYSFEIILNVIFFSEFKSSRDDSERVQSLKNRLLQKFDDKIKAIINLFYCFQNNLLI
jgi:hypothetical protein